MQYECVHCDERFEVSAVGAGDERPRCPKCLRQHGLRKLDTPKQDAARPRRVAVALAVVFCAGAGAAYVFFARDANGGTGGLALMAEKATGQRVEQAGAKPRELASLLAANGQIEAFAERAASGVASAPDRARAIVAAIAAHGRKQAFVAWSRAEVRDGPDPLIARDVLAKVERDGGRAQLYPLELAALAVAALRSLGVPAFVAEVYAYAGERGALDPSGRLGYYVAALAGAAGAAPLFYDVYGARQTQPQPGDYAVLDDVQVLGAALALRAMHRLGKLADPKAALEDADAAAKLAPSSPTVRGAHAAVLLASGGSEAGARELEAAAQQRPDAARRNNLAMLALATGDAERAAKETALALAEAPDFAAAHLTLASVHLGRGESDLARSELEKVESLDAALPALTMAWAEFYASTGDTVRAVAKAEQGVRARPAAPETHLVLARIYRAAARYDDMRLQARQALALAPASERERVTALLHNLLGPTALEEPSVPEAAPDAQPAQAIRPETGAADLGALQLGGGTPKLHLGGGSGGKLKLDLGN